MEKNYKRNRVAKYNELEKKNPSFLKLSQLRESIYSNSNSPRDVIRKS